MNLGGHYDAIIPAIFRDAIAPCFEDAATGSGGQAPAFPELWAVCSADP